MSSFRLASTFEKEGINDNSNKNNSNNVQIDSHKNQSTGSKSSQQQATNRQQHERQRVDCARISTTQFDRNANKSIERYKLQLEDLRASGQRLRSDVGQPNLSEKPNWLDEDMFENAKSVYNRHFMGVNFAHLSGLLLLVRVNSIYRTLKATEKSDSVAKLFKRYFETVLHVKKWYEGDIFEPSSEAQRSLMIVRGMHNKVSMNLNKDHNEILDNQFRNLYCKDHNGNGFINYDEYNGLDHCSSKLMAQNQYNKTTKDQKRETQKLQSQVHISEYDLMLTQFAFLGFIVTRAKSVGLIDDFSQYDLESLLHFWRVIGYYLGASDKFNLCSRQLDDVIGLCEAMMELEFKDSILRNPIASDPGIMGVNIVRSVKFIPMLTIYGITKYLYELIDIDASEFEARATRYSKLSYTLIKLVMSRLLAYRGLRWFNNGLTRLSIFLVGKLEQTFANHLESKYGQELKL